MSQLQRAEASQIPNGGSGSLTPHELQIVGSIVAYSIMYGCSLSTAADDYGLDPETATKIREHLGLDDGQGY
jgi:hypothetical protein